MNTIMKRLRNLMLCAAFIACAGGRAEACTGIALNAKDGSRIVARTVEWAAGAMDCGYAVVPRGYRQQSLTPDGETGLAYKARYGYVGIWTQYDTFLVEGVNEAGLSAGLFFFPGYGKYPEFKSSEAGSSVCDMQFVNWVLASFSTIDELKEGLSKVKVVSLDPRIETVHWRISEPGGRVVVLEYKNGEARFHEDPLGVLTNSPDFDWHMTNLSNYVNLRPGAAGNLNLGGFVTARPTGGGSAMLGLPGDFTPASRFVRAAFLSATAPQWQDGYSTVVHAFHILNNFDIPIGIQNAEGHDNAELQSATQFTSATDLKARRLYWRTWRNSNLRCIDLGTINFRKVKYRTAPLDELETQPCETLRIE